MLLLAVLFLVSALRADESPPPLCQIGQYYNDGSCLPCPKGHRCPYQSKEPEECPAGTYQNEEGQSECKVCSLDPDNTETGRVYCPNLLLTREGSEKSILSSRADDSNYLEYTYEKNKVVVTIDGESEEFNCDDGTYSQPGFGQCIPVPIGTVPDKDSDSGYKWCSEGEYSTPGDTECKKCEDGLMCNPTYTYPYNRYICEPGTYLNEIPGQVKKCQACPQGHYCVEGKAEKAKDIYYVTNPPVAQIICPAGSSCSGGIRKLCPPGTYSDGTGSTSCKVCPQGTYSNYPGATSCSPCPDGFYQDETGQSTCKICPRGYQCSDKGNKALCGEGYYSYFEGGTECKKCPPGFTCDDRINPVMCPDGQINNGNGTCKPCPVGQECKNVASTGGGECTDNLISEAGVSYCHMLTAGYEFDLVTKKVVKCEAGKVCSTWSSSPTNEEFAEDLTSDGYYLPAGSQNPRQEICPPGSYCNEGKINGCGKEQYAANYGQSECNSVDNGFIFRDKYTEPYSSFDDSLCPVGYFCVGGVKNTCGGGKYMPFRGATDGNECMEAPSGYYSEAESADLIECPEGNYCPPGSSKGSPCPSGTYNPYTQKGSEDDCLACPIGYYCGEGTSQPLPCPAGSYGRTNKLGDENDCTLCEPGYFCPVQALASYEHYVCPPGFYCPRGSIVPIMCPGGTYNPSYYGTSLESCIICPAGLKCGEGTEGLTLSTEVTTGIGVATICPKGEYCPPGTKDSTTIYCPAGTYNNNTGATSINECLPCPAGMMCKMGTVIPEITCSENYYCPQGTEFGYPIHCPAGTHTKVSMSDGTIISTGAKSQADCVLTDPGEYRTEFGVTKSCPPGTYSILPGSVSSSDVVGRKPENQCNICESGYFCSGGSHVEHCPAGSYSGYGWDKCAECVAGFYCVDSISGYGVSEDDMYSKYRCPKGLNCPAGKATVPLYSNEDDLCPRGYYCPEATREPIPIPKGYYSTAKGIASLSELSKCPAGYYCEGGESGLTDNPENYDISAILKPCEANHFCPEGSYDKEMNKCPVGTYNPYTGAPNSNYCSSCPAGFFCDGNPHEYTENSDDGTKVVYYYRTCSLGYYCPSGAIKEEPCPPGTYVEETTSSSSDSVPPRGLTLAEECIKCPAGKYCSKYAMTVKSKDDVSDYMNQFENCNKGFYCMEGATVPTPRDGITGDVCPTGGYCPEGSSEPKPCPNGKYSLVEGGTNEEDSCSTCPGGYYCNSSTYNLNACKEGWYCPPGTACVPDEDGICNGYNSSMLAFKCPDGSYCPSGSASPILCDVGNKSLEGQGTCNKCEMGRYCAEPGTSDAEGSSSNPIKEQPCPAGYYCGADAAENPIPCPVGTYRSTMLASDLSQCSPCPAGSYCSSEGLSSPSGKCLAGYRCGGGSTSATPSENGVYIVCEKHHYCLEGSSTGTLCPNGTYSGEITGNDSVGGNPNNDGIVTRTSEESCLPCPPGKMCTQSDDGTTMMFANCTAGFYCASGAYLVGNTPSDGKSEDNGEVSRVGSCEAGYYCPEGTIVPGPCPDGKFCEGEGRISPEECHPGYMCPTGSSTLTEQCPEGSYCTEGTGFNTQQCPIGTYRNQKAGKSVTDCSMCPEGYFCSEKGLVSVTDRCYPGYVCSTGCVNGKCSEVFTEDSYKDGEIKEVSIVPCPEGYYCPNDSEGGSKKVCKSGTYRPFEFGKSEDDCYECEYAHICSNGESIECSDGFYCESGSYVQTTCEEGRYCDGGFGPYECKPGSYTTGEGSSTCISCDEGYYCNPYVLDKEQIEFSDNGKSTPLECSQGYYCPSETSDPELYPCPAGTYSTSIDLRSDAECSSCTEGNYCHIIGANTTQGNCSDGFICESGSTNPTPSLCPSGYYCKDNNAIACEEGNFCSGVGYTEMTGPCGAGFYCESGSQDPTPTNGVEGDLCLEGGYCHEGTKPDDVDNCLLSEWTTSRGLFQVYQCSGCPAGYKCTDDYGSQGVCPEGQYCPPKKLYIVSGETEGMNIEEFLEYLEKHNDDGYNGSVTISVENAEPCGLGHYCPAGVSEPIACPAGSFQDEEGKSTCKACEEGQYSEEGANICSPCLKGHYCRFRDIEVPFKTTEQIPCEIGTYNNEEGRTEQCIACSEGNYCPYEGMSLPLRCPQGYYCPEGTISYEPFECIPGYYCPWGSSAGIACPAGTYSPEAGLQMESQCIPCPPGYTCPTPGSVSPGPECDRGYYCEGGVSEIDETVEGTGTYAKCPAGYYCPAGSAKPIPCEPGTVSSEGAFECSEVVDGKYQDKIGQSTEEECPKGYYCPGNTDYYFNYRCSIGTYGSKKSSPDTSNCVSCTAGKYCDKEAAEEPTGDCSAGYVCQGGAETYTPGDLYIDPMSENGLCQPGYYCEKGSSSITACPEGTYYPFYGATSEGDCIPCPAGMYCYSSGMSLVDNISIPSTGISVEDYLGKLSNLGGFFDNTLLCSPGYICPEGTSNFDGTNEHSAIICEPGTYCPEGSTSVQKCKPGEYQTSRGQDSCTICDFGNYCDKVSMENPTRCGEGHFCDEDGMTAPLPCPMGTDSLSDNLTGMEMCTECGEGEFCPFLGQTPEDKAKFDSYLCDAGYYCKTGSPARNPGPEGSFSLVWNKTGITVTNVLDAGPCTKGHYCVEGTSTPTECPKGTFNVGEYGASEDYCRKCEAGEYCATNGLTEPTGVCSYGYFCSSGSVVAKPQESIDFKDGHEAKMGVFDAGYNNGVLDTDYIKEFTQGRCPKGHKCQPGSIEPIPCEPGTTAQESSKSCKSAKEGTYVSYFGSLEEEEGCNMYGRSYCLSGSIHPEICPAGTQLRNDPNISGNGISSFEYFISQLNTRSNSSINKNCIDCQSGRYCYADRSGICKAGYYCDSGTREHYFEEETNKCPQGYYCEDGVSSPLACRQGTYSEEMGLESQSECLYCQGGYYCQDQASTTQISCPLGYYCGIITSKNDFKDDSSSIGRAVCGNNAYCPPNSITGIGCPAGYIGINESVGGTGTSTTTQGFNLLSYLVSELSVETSKKYHSLGSLDYDQIGSGVDGIDSMDYISSGCKLTPEGSYNFVRAGSGALCPDTSYCPEGSIIPIECPFGTWILSSIDEIHKSESDCNTCPEGRWCRGGIDVGDCVGGFVCFGSSDVSRPGEIESGISNASSLNNNLGIGKVCERNYYCIPGSNTMEACPDRKYTFGEGSWHETQCVDCPAGYVCDGDLVDSKAGVEDDTIPFPCPLGYYCPRLSGPTKCPIGTYGTDIRAYTISVCGSCPEGFYCPIEGIPAVEALVEKVSDEYICPKNHFCPKGSTSPYLCPGGTYRKETGGGKVDDCHICEPGYYCSNSEDALDDEDIEPKKCPVNYYCPEGTEVPILCPIGTMTVEGVSVHTSLYEACIPCQPGYYCTYESNYQEESSSGIEIEIVPQPCSEGYICTGGAFMPNPTTPITGGYICPYGNYCESGAIVESPCPAGTYNDILGIGRIVHCKKCPTNSYNRETGQRYCTLCGASAFTSPYVVKTSTSEIVVDNENIDIYYDGVEGNKDCYCIGHNRVFQYSDNMCVCLNGFITESDSSLSILTNNNVESSEDYMMILKGENEDSKSDCVPIDHVACTSRMLDGTCIDFVNVRTYVEVPISTNSANSNASGFNIEKLDNDEYQLVLYDSICENKCGSSGGYFDTICECYNTKSLVSVCDRYCRSYHTRIYIDSTSGTDSLIVVEPRTVNTSIRMDTFTIPIDEYQVVSASSHSGRNEAYIIRVDVNGFSGFLDFNYVDSSYSGDIPPSTSLEGIDIINDDLSQAVISDPFVCINVGNSIIFEIRDGHIPEYTSSSKLNNNTSYDMGSFRKLKQLMFSEAPVRYFVHTFTSEGIFTFNDVVNKSHIIIVRVISSISSCPDGVAFLPSTVSNLDRLNTTIDDDVMLGFDIGQSIYALLLAFVICITAILYVYLGSIERLRIRKMPRPIYEPIEGNKTSKPLNIIKYLTEMPHKLFPVSKKLSKKVKSQKSKSKYTKAIHDACKVYMRYQRNGIGEVMGPGRIALLLDRQEEILKNMDYKSELSKSKEVGDTKDKVKTQSSNMNKKEKSIKSIPIKYDPRRKYDSSLFYDVCSLVPEFTAAHLYDIIDNDVAMLGEHVDSTNERLEDLFNKLNKRVEEIKESVTEKHSQMLQSSLDITNSELSKKQQRAINVVQRKERAQAADKVVVNAISDLEQERTRRSKLSSTLLELLNKIISVNNSNYIVINDILDNPQNESGYKILEGNVNNLAATIENLRMKLSEDQKERGILLNKLSENFKVAGRLVDSNGSIVSESSLSMEVKGEAARKNVISVVPGLYHPSPTLKIVTANNQKSPESLSSSYYNYFIAANGRLYTIYNKVFVIRNSGVIITLPEILGNVIKRKITQILDERDYIQFIPMSPTTPIQVPSDNSFVFSRMRQKTVMDSRTGLCVPTEYASVKVSDNEGIVVALGGVTSDPVSGLLAPQQMVQLMNVQTPISLLSENATVTSNNKQLSYGLTSGISVTEQGQTQSVSAYNRSGQPIVEFTKDIDAELGTQHNISGVYNVHADVLKLISPNLLNDMIERITTKDTTYNREQLKKLSYPAAFGNGIELVNVLIRWKQLQSIIEEVEENIKRISVFRLAIEGANKELVNAMNKARGEMDKMAAEYEAMEMFQMKVNRASIELTTGNKEDEGVNSTNAVIIKLTLAVESMIKRFIEQEVIYSRPLNLMIEKLQWEHKMLEYTKQTGNACSTSHPITFPQFDIPSGSSGDIIAENVDDLEVQPYIIPTPSVETINNYRAYISAQSNIRSHYLDDVSSLHKSLYDINILIHNILKYHYSAKNISSGDDKRDAESEVVIGDINDIKDKITLIKESYKKLFDNETTRRKLEDEHVGIENLLNIIYSVTFSLDNKHIKLQDKILQELDEVIDILDRIMKNIEETDDFFNAVENDNKQTIGMKHRKKDKEKSESDLINEYEGLFASLEDVFSNISRHSAKFEAISIESKASYSEMSELLALKRDVLKANKDIAEKFGSGSSVFGQNGNGPNAQSENLTTILSNLLKGVDSGKPKFLANVLNTKIVGEDENEKEIENELAQANAELVQNNLTNSINNLQDLTLSPFGQMSLMNNNPASMALSIANNNALIDSLISPSEQQGQLQQAGVSEASKQYIPPQNIVMSDSFNTLEKMNPETLKAALIQRNALSEVDEGEERNIIDSTNHEIESNIIANHALQLQLLVERGDDDDVNQAIREQLIRSQSASQKIAGESLNALVNISRINKLQNNKTDNDIEKAKKELEVLENESNDLIQKEADDVARVRAEIENENKKEIQKMEDTINRARAAEKERLLTQQGIERGLLSKKLDSMDVSEDVRRAEFRKLSDVHKTQMEAMEARMEADEIKQRELLKKMLENKRKRRETEIKYTYQEKKTQNEIAKNKVKSDILALEAMGQDTVEIKEIEENNMKEVISQLKDNEARLITKLETVIDPEGRRKIVAAYAKEVEDIEKRVEADKIRQINELRARIAKRREKLIASKQVGEGQLVISNNERKTQLEKDVAMFDNEEKDARANLNLVSQMREKRTESIEKIAEVLRTNGASADNVISVKNNSDNTIKEKLSDVDSNLENEDNNEETQKVKKEVVFDLDIDTSSQTNLLMSCERAMDALDGKLNAEYDRQRDNLRKMIEMKRRNQLKRIAQNEMDRRAENEEIEEDLNQKGETLVRIDDSNVQRPIINSESAQATDDLKSQIAKILDIEKNKLEKLPSPEITNIKQQQKTVVPQVEEQLKEPDVDAETEELRKKQEEEYRLEVERLNKEAEAEMNRIKEEAKRRKAELLKRQASSQMESESGIIEGLMNNKTIDELESMVNDEIQSQQIAARNMLEARKKERLQRLKAKQERQMEEKRKILLAAKDEIETKKKQLAERRTINTILQSNNKKQAKDIPDIVCITLQERHRDEFTKLLINQQQEEAELIKNKKNERLSQYKKRRDDLINVFNKRMEELSSRKDSDVDLRKKQLRENHNRELKSLEELYGINRQDEDDIMERDDDVISLRIKHMNERKEIFERQKDEIQEIIKNNSNNEDLLKYEEEISMRVLQMHNELESQALEKISDNNLKDQELKDSFEITTEGEESEDENSNEALDLPSVSKISDQLKKFVPSGKKGGINAGMYQGIKPIDLKALTQGQESAPNMLEPLENESRNQLEIFRRKIEERRRQRNGGNVQNVQQKSVDKDEEVREIERQKRLKAEEKLARIKEMEKRKNEEILAKIREKRLKREVLGDSASTQQTSSSELQKEVAVLPQKPIVEEPTVLLSNKVVTVEGNMGKLVTEVKQIVDGDEGARKAVASKTSPPFIAQLDVLECEKDGIAPMSAIFDTAQVESEVVSTVIDEERLSSIEKQALDGIIDLIDYMSKSGYKNVHVEICMRVPACRLHPYMRSYYYNQSDNTLYICRARLDIRSQSRRDELATMVTHVLAHIAAETWEEDDPKFKKKFVEAIGVMAMWRGAF